MNTANPKQKLKEFYQALKERPLDPRVDAEIYEPYVAALPDGDPIARLYAGVNFAESQSLQLVTGQRGTGKSTELLRLRNMLQDGGYTVFYIDMLDYLHPSEPVEITDFLMALCLGLAATASQMDEKLDTLRLSYWKRLSQFFTAIKLQKATLGVEGMGVSFGVELAENLRIDDTFKQQLQDAARGHIKSLVKDAHGFINDLVTAIRKFSGQQDQQIVLVVDSFEQIRGRYDNAEKVHDTIAKLFSTHGEHLQLPRLHTIITVPPYLNSAAPGVARVLGSMPVISLPSIHVRQQGNTDVDEHGVAIMQKIVYRRSEYARQIFNDAGLRELAIASGGDLRDFFLLVRASLIIASTSLSVELPLLLPVIKRAKEQLQRSMLPIHDRAVSWLSKIHTTQQAELPDLKHLPELAALFDNNLVINYRNGSDWYGIHPLIIDYVLERQQVLDEREADH